MMELIDRIKQQGALFASIGHWEENKQLDYLTILDGLSASCELCHKNGWAKENETTDCESCLLDDRCSRFSNYNPWYGTNTNCDHMINYLKLHQLHSDILIEPGIN